MSGIRGEIPMTFNDAMEITPQMALDNWNGFYWGKLLKAGFKGAFSDYWEECLRCNAKVKAMREEQNRSRLNIADLNNLLGGVHSQGLKLIGICLDSRTYDDLLASIKNGMPNAQKIDSIYGLPVQMVEMPDALAVISE